MKSIVLLQRLLAFVALWCPATPNKLKSLRDLARGNSVHFPVRQGGLSLLSLLVFVPRTAPGQHNIRTADNHRRSPHTPGTSHPPDHSDHREKTEIYNGENLIGPFLVHNFLLCPPPPPPPRLLSSNAHVHVQRAIIP